MGKVYKTMQGREIDMEKLMRQNELMPAVGNIKVNARGDELGPGGKIIKRKEDIMSEYYERNSNSKKTKPETTQNVPEVVNKYAEPAVKEKKTKRVTDESNWEN